MHPDVYEPSAERLAEAEAELSGTAPSLLARVRGWSERIGVLDVETTGAREALEAVSRLSEIDLDVPTVARRRLARGVKRGVKLLVAWYLGYFGRQIAALGEAVAHLGSVLVDRTERLESRVEDLQSQLDDLARRFSPEGVPLPGTLPPPAGSAPPAVHPPSEVPGR